jgi:hypothetical protein
MLLGLARLFGLCEVVDRDIGALLGEAHGDRLADAGAAAGDEDVLALEAGHQVAAGGRSWSGVGHGAFLSDRTVRAVQSAM